MSTLSFLTAVYNEEDEILDLLQSVAPYVDQVVVSDDGSTDRTVEIAEASGLVDVIVLSEHSASCEETRQRGFRFVTGDWLLFLDADERIDPQGMEILRKSIPDLERDGVTHVYFSQDEVIDNRLLQTFAKIKMARTDSIHFPTGIHDEVRCDGEPVNLEVRVLHRKTTEKQVMRERQYLEAYERKIAEGKMTRQRATEVSGWHHFVRSRDAQDT